MDEHDYESESEESRSIASDETSESDGYVEDFDFSEEALEVQELQIHIENSEEFQEMMGYQESINEHELAKSKGRKKHAQKDKGPKIRDGAKTLDIRQVASKFSTIVQKATQSNAVLGGGAAINALGGKRTVKDLDFRLIPTKKITPEMIAFINKETQKLFKKGGDLVAFEYKNERSKTTIVGEINDTEISLTAQPESYNQNGVETGEELDTLDATSLIMEKVIGLNHRDNAPLKIAQDLYDIGTLYYLKKENIDTEFINNEIESRGEDIGELEEQIEEISDADNPKEAVKQKLLPIFGTEKEAKKHVKKVWNGLQMLMEDLG